MTRSLRFSSRSSHIMCFVAMLKLMALSTCCRAFVPAIPDHTSSRITDTGRSMSVDNENGDLNYDQESNTKQISTRREALESAASAFSAAAGVLVASTSTPQTAEAIDLPNFLLPKSRQSADNGAYKQARRATAYLVDSTIPPSLVPFRASREAAILKQLGQGSGTSKDAFVEDALNLNNIAQKAIFGTGDIIKGVTGMDSGDNSGAAAEASGKKDATFVFLGVDSASSEDADLAAGLLTDIVKPRQRGEATALGLAFCPLSTQNALDAYMKTGDEGALTQVLVAAEVDPKTLDTYLPLLTFARSKKLALLALAPEAEDVRVVRSEGLQNVNLERRQNYVADAEGFIALTQDPKYKLYADKSLFKDFIPQNDKDSAGNYFAERILVHEAIATSAVKWTMGKPDALVAVVAPLKDVRFMGGPNGRVPRVMKYVNPLSNIDEEAVTTILLNPSAEETLSKSNFLRLEIGTTPKTLQYQTKVADYLWFSRMPKVNTLPRMMNYR